MKRVGRLVKSAVAVPCVVALCVACSSSGGKQDSGGTGSGGTGGASSGGSSDTLASVYSALQGLTGSARYDKLLSLAKKEGGSVSVYHTGSMTDLEKAFTKQTGIKVSDYKATSERLIARISSEYKAKRVGADVIHGGGSDMAALDQNGVFNPIEGPVTDLVKSQYKTKDLIAPYTILAVPAYNTQTLKSSDVPASYEQLFKGFSGKIGLEMTDWNWMRQIVEEYFVKKKGMSESAAIALVTNGLKGATAIDGHTLEAQLLASGQYDLSAYIYDQYLPPLIKKGAPIEVIAAPERPPYVNTGAAALPKDAPHPAAGLLFLNYWMSSDGQNEMQSEGYVPLSSNYKGPATLLDKYPYALPDNEMRLTPAEVKKWEGLFQQVVSGAGAKKSK